jgi:hypothetical protein
MFAAVCCSLARPAAAQPPSPNIVLMMADDQGWGETGYQILKQAGYRTAHFGKWHLGPVKRESPLSPGRMGFDEYLSHDNFFELNPPLSRNGAAPEVVPGESSEVIVDAAVAFTRRVVAERKPFFVVIHFGSPHDPYSGKPEDVASYARLGKEIGGRFAEIAAMDRAVGTYRAALDELKAREHTLVWFNSDNRFKLLVRASSTGDRAGVVSELYDLLDDPREATDIAAKHPDIVRRMTDALRAWQRSVERSLTGSDYR